MKILSAKQQQKADKHTIENEPVSSIALMERASKMWVEHALPFFKSNTVIVFAGIGNNGGDGFAIARLLQNRGFTVSVLHFQFGKNCSPDCITNKEKLPVDVECKTFKSKDEIANVSVESDAILIDAVFGSGLSRPVEAPFSSGIELFNSAEAKQKLAVDIPSGLFSENPNNENDLIAKCGATLTFQAPKLSFFFPENHLYVGDFSTVNIDLDSTYLKKLECENECITSEYAKSNLLKRLKISHKGSYGHLGIIKGNENTLGAGYMAALSAFSSGAGYVSLLDYKGTKKLEYWPELMHKELNKSDIKNYTLCIGPGLGTDEIALKKLETCLTNTSKPVVLDADAINLIGQNSALIELLPENSILTPHPKELQRLLGLTFENSFVQLQKAKDFAKKHKIILLIKRANTIVIDKTGKAFFNLTGNPSLAKAGSGDVLSGIIASFLCQGYSSIDAAKLGVLVHGKVADHIVSEISTYSLTPPMLIKQIGKTLKKLGV